MASFLQRNNPWIESNVLYAVSFDPDSHRVDIADHADADNDARNDINDNDDDYDEEPQTENTIPSGLLPSPKCDSSHELIPPSRRGKIVQVIQRGGNFDWQHPHPGRQRHHHRGGGGGTTYCPPYLVVHDGQYSIIAFLSPGTLQKLSSSSTIVSNRSLVSITNYTVSTILQCCQKQCDDKDDRPQQPKKLQLQQQQQQQQQQQPRSKLTFDFELHSQLLNHLYFTINSSNNHRHRNYYSHHEPNGYTLIPPEIQSQLPLQITNNELYLCLYIQGTLNMIGAENQGLIGFPKDVHCSPKLRQAIMGYQITMRNCDKNKEMEEEKEEGEKEMSRELMQVRGESYSHFMLMKKLEAIHSYYCTLDEKKKKEEEKKKNGNREVINLDGDDDNDEQEGSDHDKEDEKEEDDDDDNSDGEWIEKQQHSKRRGKKKIIVGDKTKKQYGRRGQKNRDIVRRDISSLSRTKRATATNMVPKWPWESRLVDHHSSNFDRAAVSTTTATTTSSSSSSTSVAHTNTNVVDDNINESEIQSALRDEISPTPNSICANNYDGSQEASIHSRAEESIARRDGIPPTTETLIPTSTTFASSRPPPMGNVQELFELGVDIEEFLSMESQSDSDDNAVLAAAESTVSADIGDDRIQQEQSPRHEDGNYSTQADFDEVQDATSNEASFVGINEMFDDDDDDDDDSDNSNDGDECDKINTNEETPSCDGGDIDFDNDENEQIFQTQPEAATDYYKSKSPCYSRRKEVEEEINSQVIPLLTIQQTRDQPFGEKSRQPGDGSDAISPKFSSQNKRAKRKISKRRINEEEECPIPISQRKPPPETLEGYLGTESQIPIVTFRNIPGEPLVGVAEDSEGDIGIEEDDDEPIGGRPSQIPIDIKARQAEGQTKKIGNSAARSAKRTASQREANTDDDDSSDDWMRVRKRREYYLNDESDDSSDVWMKVRRIPTAKVNERIIDDNGDDDTDDVVVDDDDDDINDVDDGEDEEYEPTYECQMAGENSEEVLPSPASAAKSVLNISEGSKQMDGNYQRKNARVVASSTESVGSYNVTNLSSKASIMLGFTSSAKSVQRKVGSTKKNRGEQFDVASVVEKAQKLCGFR